MCSCLFLYVRQTIHGDIYDCVDIYKQPGMDHPTMATERVRVWCFNLICYINFYFDF